MIDISSQKQTSENTISSLKENITCLIYFNFEIY